MAAPNRGRGPFTSQEITAAAGLLRFGRAPAQRSPVITTAPERPAAAVGQIKLDWVEVPGRSLNNTMLYHATDKAHLPSILSRGLAPSLVGTLGRGIYLSTLPAALEHSSAEVEVVLAVEFAPNGSACYREPGGWECAVKTAIVVGYADVKRASPAVGRGPRYQAKHARRLLASARAVVKDGIDFSPYLRESSPG